MDYDFCGWATKNNLRCADGKVIKKDAFKEMDNTRVPLVWNHVWDDPSKVLGHAILENRSEGVYAYGYFNESKAAQEAKEGVIHGDITNMSIWANEVLVSPSQNGVDLEVLHGVIREVSLVLAGKNPGAYIESTLAHGMPMEIDETEGIIYTNEPLIISHSDLDDKKDKDEKTVADVYEEMTDEQKDAVAILLSEAIKAEKEDNKNDEGGNNVRHNLFDTESGKKNQTILSHSDQKQILKDAKKMGSFKEAIKMHLEEGGILAHAIDTTGMVTPTETKNYGVNDLGMFFPDYKSEQTTPIWISREMGWVQKVLSAVHHVPFARIKSLYANITEDEARAKGYIKGNQKKEEVFTTLKRTTDPQTVYKRQKLDRDDILDITDFDTVAWIRAEMRMMLNEELARAYLIGDGRPSDSDDKIRDTNIRPIATDVPLFNTIVKVPVGTTPAETAKNTINQVIRSRKHYKGSGRPAFWTIEDVITEMLLLEDGNERKLYKTEQELATTLRVSEIIPVEPMEGQTITISGSKYPLIGVIVNMSDYNVGTVKGGEIRGFEDFDIDYNQQKYLLETRQSGALTRPFSAITLVQGTAVSSSEG